MLRYVLVWALGIMLIIHSITLFGQDNEVQAVVWLVVGLAVLYAGLHMRQAIKRK